jgi:hypothetical protein
VFVGKIARDFSGTERRRRRSAVLQPVLLPLSHSIPRRQGIAAQRPERIQDHGDVDHFLQQRPFNGRQIVEGGGNPVWCRRFEVPASVAANPSQELQIEKRH